MKGIKLFVWQILFNAMLRLILDVQLEENQELGTVANANVIVYFYGVVFLLFLSLGNGARTL